MRRDELRRTAAGSGPGGLRLRAGMAGRPFRLPGIVVLAVACLLWGTGASGDPSPSGPQEPSASRSAAASQEASTSQPPSTSPELTGAKFAFDSSYELAAGERESDLFVWSQRAVLRGTVEDNAFVGAQVARLEPEGRIAGDLYAFAQSVTIDGRVDGDVYFWSAAVEIGPDAVIGGNLYGGAGELALSGTVEGLVDVHAGHTLIDGRVGGSVEVDCGELQVGPNARIAGDLTYAAGKPAEIDDGAEILGDLRRREAADEEGEDEEGGWLDLGWWSVAWKTAMFLGSLLVGAFLLWLGGAASREPARHLADTPARGLGLGFVVSVVTPVVAAIGLLFGIVPGVFGFAVFFVAVYLARLVTSLCMGVWALQRLRPAVEPSPYAGLLLGLVAFYLITAVPYVGFLFWVAAVVAGLGGLFLALQAGRRRSPASVPPEEPEAAVETA